MALKKETEIPFCLIWTCSQPSQTSAGPVTFAARTMPLSLFVQLSFKNKSPKTEDFCLRDSLQPWTVTLRPENVNSRKLSTWFSWSSSHGRNMFLPKIAEGIRPSLRCSFSECPLLPHLQPCWGPHVDVLPDRINFERFIFLSCQLL